MSILTFGGMEPLNTKERSFGNGIRIGGGIKENFVLYLEARNLLVSFGTEDVDGFFDTQIKGQYYPWSNLYINLGAGLALSLLGLSPLGKAGFSLSSGFGYEFRIGRKFFLAPEFRLGYLHVENASTTRRDNYLTTEGGIILGWHF